MIEGEKMKKRADGRWVKKKMIDGVPVFFYSVEDTEKKASRDIENQMLEYQKERYRKKHNFKYVADQMLEYQSELVSYNTAQCYHYSIKHLSPLFGLDIEEIEPSMVQKIFDDMNTQGYSFSAISKTKVVYGLITDYAIVHLRLNISNFTRSLKIPKGAKKGKVTAPPDETSSLIFKNAKSTEFGLWALVLLCTGLRRGELAALQRKNVNLQKNEIFVDNAVEFVNNKARLKETPKTEASIDSVPILGIVRPYIEELCEGLEPDEFLFGKEKPLSETQIKKRWKKYCAEIGHSFNGHQLRHAYARMIYEAGIDVKTAQRLLRHKNFQTTMNIYTEFSNKMTNQAIEMLNNFTQNIAKI